VASMQFCQQTLCPCPPGQPSLQVGSALFGAERFSLPSFVMSLKVGGRFPLKRNTRSRIRWIQTGQNCGPAMDVALRKSVQCLRQLSDRPLIQRRFRDSRRAAFGLPNSTLTRGGVVRQIAQKQSKW
jgi:hypothetical protein